MIPDLPEYILVIFTLTTLLTILFFYWGTNRSIPAMFILLGWMVLQGFIGNSEFYTATDVLPPRFLLLVGPPLLTIILLFITRSGRRLMDSWLPSWLTHLHIVRIPVEIVLYLLFVHKQIPELMTFAGRNFDILAGITAPLVGFAAYSYAKMSRHTLLLWNIVCLGLLLNIVISAILSAPFPFQQLAFDQPNVAVFYYPFVWLPGVIVPIVLLSHLVSIRSLVLGKPIGGPTK